MEQYKSIFFVGIKGVAMANLARIMHKMGKKVSGCDVDETFITDHLLNEHNIPVINSFDPADLPNHVDLVVYSAAHGGNNNEIVKKAQRNDIQTMHQAEFIGKLMNLYKTTIAIAGCHGKTSTSSLLSYSLIKLGVDPSYMVGVSDFIDDKENFVGGDHNVDTYFVVEADEYAINPPDDKTPKFHFMHPNIALITNIDFDHPDVFDSLGDTIESFSTFIQNVKDVIVICADDEQLMKINRHIKDKKLISYGFSSDSHFKITDVSTHEHGSKFKVNGKQYEISLYGEKNNLNAAGVISVLFELGFNYEEIKTSIKSFKGAKRRFELVYHKDQIYLFDDYAHHPNEISATIEAARARFPEHKIVVLFQPHTYSRTQSLQNEFVQVLSLSDKAIILPIFSSARENAESYSISSRKLEEIAKNKGIYSVKSVESKVEAIQMFKEMIESKMVIFTMGAGDVYKMKDTIINAIDSNDFK